MSGQSEAAASNTQPISTVDPFQRLQITRNPDGTITRFGEIPLSPPQPDPTNPTPVLSKDIPINQSNKTWLRLYLPRTALDRSASSTSPKLPLIVYYHGGGFILFNADSTGFHDFCSDLAADVSVVVASVEYRLAPEHRLPAAYDDAMEALHWIKASPDDWLKNYTDVSNCFVMGSSSGGNIAYQTALRADVDHLRPLTIQGLILQQPFFGGTQRSGSELRLVNDPALPLSATDLMWELSLPVGVDRDHEYCNPTVPEASKRLDRMKTLGWRVFVTGCDGDPLVDRQMEVAKILEGKGVKVVRHFFEGGYHGVDIMNPEKAKALLGVLKSFIFSK